MKATEVKIRRKEGNDKSKVLAYADIVFDNTLAVHGLALIQGDTGLYVGMPFREDPNQKRGKLDIVHPINNEGRMMIERAVIEAYKNA